MIRINGKKVVVQPDETVAGLLQREGYDLRRVAVERNGWIVPRASYAEVPVMEDDVYEVVSFVGGG